MKNWNAIQRNAAAKKHAEELGAHKKLAKNYQDAIDELQGQLDVVLKLDRSLRQPEIMVPCTGEAGHCAAVVVASDWHVEETVKPEAVSGLNEFHLGVADFRINKFFNAILRLTEINRNGADIPTLVLFLGGDFMTGFIHPELVESNGLTPTQTVLWLHERLVSGLLMLEKHGGFQRIIIPCAYGNHGRTTDKPRVSTAAQNSYEWLLYKIMERELPQFEWRVGEGYHTYLEVLGRTLRLHHGDAMKYEGGIGGLTIPAEKAVASWNKARVADLDIFGHHHTQMQGQRWVSNGSLIGYGPFSIKIKAPYEPPQQTYFLLDEKRGRTGTWPIYLTD